MLQRSVNSRAGVLPGASRLNPPLDGDAVIHLADCRGAAGATLAAEIRVGTAAAAAALRHGRRPRSRLRLPALAERGRSSWLRAIEPADVALRRATAYIPGQRARQGNPVDVHDIADEPDIGRSATSQYRHQCRPLGSGEVSDGYSARRLVATVTGSSCRSGRGASSSPHLRRMTGDRVGVPPYPSPGKRISPCDSSGSDGDHRDLLL